jgi:glycosyltransferase involved in cell wall biosynthesis
MPAADTISQTTHTPSLDDLPTPPEGKTGWPWAEASGPLPETQPDGSPWPKISIVTPSYNQGKYIEETIRSVLLQGYPNLEYVVIDGGSTDETAEILQKYDPWLDYWVSESDQGQSHAINKGFRHCSGTWGNWLNSDDLLCKGGLGRLVEEASSESTIYVGSCVFVDEHGTPTATHTGDVHTVEELLVNHQDYIPQPAALFPLSRFWEVGGVNVLSHYTMDFELWGKLIMTGTSVTYVDIDVAMFRSYEGQKVSEQEGIVREVVENAKRLVKAQRSWSAEKKEKMLDELDTYSTAARLGGGRLVEWGLPEPLIRMVREGWHG